MVSQPRFPAVHMPAATGDALLVRLLREGLSQAMAADCIDLVLALALNRACLERVPSGGERLRRFLVGPLTDAMEGFVGAMVAASTVDTLQAILAPMLAREVDDGASQSGVRTAAKDVFEQAVPEFPEADTSRYTPIEDPTRSEDPTLRVPLVPGAVVVLVTQDPAAPRRLQGQLDPAFRVIAATEIFSVMDALRQANHQRALLVFDCRRPPIPPSMMLSVTDRLREGTQVVLWGSPTQIDQQTSAVGRAASTWLRCDEQAIAEDIGTLIGSALIRCA